MTVCSPQVKQKRDQLWRHSNVSPGTSSLNTYSSRSINRERSLLILSRWFSFCSSTVPARTITPATRKKLFQRICSPADVNRSTTSSVYLSKKLQATDLLRYPPLFVGTPIELWISWNPWVYFLLKIKTVPQIWLVHKHNAKESTMKTRSSRNITSIQAVELIFRTWCKVWSF